MRLRAMQSVAIHLDRARGRTDNDPFLRHGSAISDHDAFEWLGKRVRDLSDRSENPSKHERLDISGLRVVARIPGEDAVPTIEIALQTAHLGINQSPNNLFELSETIGLVGQNPYHALTLHGSEFSDRAAVTGDFLAGRAMLHAIHDTISAVENFGVVV